MQGKLSMQYVMQRPGTKKVCFVAPERMDTVMAIVANLQRELMELHQQSTHNTDETYDCMKEILINLQKVPQADRDPRHGQYLFGQEDWALGRGYPTKLS